MGPPVSNKEVFVYLLHKLGTVSVMKKCLSVTENEHFLKRSVCLFVMMMMMMMKGNKTKLEIQIHKIYETNPNAFQKYKKNKDLYGT